MGRTAADELIQERLRLKTIKYPEVGPVGLGMVKRLDIHRYEYLIWYTQETSIRGLLTFAELLLLLDVMPDQVWPALVDSRLYFRVAEYYGLDVDDLPDLDDYRITLAESLTKKLKSLTLLEEVALIEACEMYQRGRVQEAKTILLAPEEWDGSYIVLKS